MATYLSNGPNQPPTLISFANLKEAELVKLLFTSEVVNTPKRFSLGTCIYRGEPTGELLDCAGCGGGKNIPVVTCSLHIECTVDRHVVTKEGKRYAWCRTCVDRIPIGDSK